MRRGRHQNRKSRHAGLDPVSGRAATALEKNVIPDLIRYLVGVAENELVVLDSESSSE